MGLSRSKQPQRPVGPNFNQPGFTTPQQGFQNPAQPGFQNQPGQGFPPNQPPLNNQQGLPNQPGFPSNHSGFPGNQQPAFPPPNNGFPNQPGFPTQSQGFGQPHGVFPPNHHGFPNHHPPGPQGFSPFPAPPPPPPQPGQQQPGYSAFPPPPLFGAGPAANCAQVFPVNYGNQSMRPLIPGYASAPSHERRGNVAQELDQNDYTSRYYTSDQIVSKSRKH